MNNLQVEYIWSNIRIKKNTIMIMILIEKIVGILFIKTDKKKKKDTSVYESESDDSDQDLSDILDSDDDLIFNDNNAEFEKIDI